VTQFFIKKIFIIRTTVTVVGIENNMDLNCERSQRVLTVFCSCALGKSVMHKENVLVITPSNLRGKGPQNLDSE